MTPFLRYDLYEATVISIAVSERVQLTSNPIDSSAKFSLRWLENWVKYEIFPSELSAQWHKVKEERTDPKQRAENLLFKCCHRSLDNSYTAHSTQQTLAPFASLSTQQICVAAPKQWMCVYIRLPFDCVVDLFLAFFSRCILCRGEPLPSGGRGHSQLQMPTAAICKR